MSVKETSIDDEAEGRPPGRDERPGQLTQVTRAMLRGQNTQVFGVYPGPIDTRMAEVLTLEKASPADTAQAIVAGIIAGNEEIFPDKMSQGAGPAFFSPTRLYFEPWHGHSNHCDDWHHGTRQPRCTHFWYRATMPCSMLA